MKKKDTNFVIAQRKRYRIFDTLSNICFSLAVIMLIATIVFGFMNNPLAFFALAALVVFAIIGLVSQVEVATANEKINGTNTSKE